MLSGTPDSFFVRFQLLKASTSRERAIMMIDVSVASMHAPIGDERVIVRVPKGVMGPTGFWILLEAVDGTRKASQMWTEFSADQVRGWGAQRNDHSPCIFRMADMDMDIEQHGDDFLVEAGRESLIWIRDRFNEAFVLERADIVSMHKDDAKEGW